MDFGLFWLGLGLATLGYFIADGLKNFKNPSVSRVMDSFNDEEECELLKEKDLHWFIGVSKEDAQKLIEKYPDVPHIRLNSKIYYPREKLKRWLIDIGTSENQ